jgi:hypothetical protein
VTVTNTALALLDEIERVEAGLLVWGVIDGALTRADVQEAAEEVADGDGEVAGNLVRELLAADLLLRRREADGAETFRTRMAETVRLAASLRQLFESNAATDWRSASRLVGDYRFSVRSRRYPARSLEVDDVIARIDSSWLPTDASKMALRALLSGAGDTTMKHAVFQAEATERILSVLNGSHSTGTVVAAGTGSGKTLAFYAPAISFLATEIERESAPWTKIVAVYPRKELLKDQFAQAYAAARTLDDFLSAGRRVSVGTYFGLTPNKLDAFSVNYVGWRQEAGGWLCPYMRCPVCGEDSLIWRAGVSGLACHRASCGATVAEGDVALTRDAVARRAPDILFTTTEMLNRGLCNSWTRPVFGIGRSVRAPRAILLDEVHTYGGLHGAAVGLLLRRYRHALGGSVQLVGLSATLRDAKQFFGALTGLPSASVATITPADEDMIDEGAEYLLALRADPTSGRSVLSTTIQTAMLLRRMLDPWDASRSDGATGRRIFLFTDKLDIANRLFFDLRDAEGQTDRGLPAPWRAEGSLANLRSTKYARNHGDDADARDAGGQLWQAVEDIGFRLDTSNLLIERTTSQDAGVDPRADIVVATASLDVGFNDPEVGAVIQHKAPRRSSQFLQRRGRAGRSRKMRPWTIVSLSDFGRDRVAYEGYDLLFDPELEPQPLPVDNRHVQRMQATYALLEWLEARMDQRGSMWRDLAGPPRKRDGTLNLVSWTKQTRRRERTLQLLDQLLTDDAMQRSLGTHLVEALDVEEEDAQRLLWDPPRALLTAVVPTAIRRLASCWGTSDGPAGTDFELRDSPLPDFVPRSLFQSLNTPDVQLRVPVAGNKFETEPLAIDATLREYCPGNVSQRLGIRRRRDRHWIPTPDPVHGLVENLNINDWVLHSEELDAYPLEPGSSEQIRVLRPLTVELKVVPRTVKSSSVAFPLWRTNITPESRSDSVDLSAEARWNTVIRSIDFFTHSMGAGVEVCRFMIAAHLSRVTDQAVSDGEVNFIRPADSGTERVALGYEAEVDAVRIRFPWPNHGLLRSRLSGATMNAVKVGLFLDAVMTDSRLSELTTDLGRRQLGELYLTALVAEASEKAIALQDAAQAIQPILAERITAIADQQGSVLRLDEDDLTNGAHLAGPASDGRRALDRLQALLGDFPDILHRLTDLAESLWQPDPDEIERFIRRRYATTVGAAFLLAFQRMCPDADLEQVVVDIDASVEGQMADLGEIWLTETTVGGGGVIEEVSREALRSPRRLMRFIEGTLEPSDLELIDAELIRVLDLAEEEDEVATALEAVRSAIRRHSGVRASSDALAQLLRSLSERGVLIAHPVISAIAARLLSPGASPASDSALLMLRRRWAEEEARLEIEIPLRTFAYAVSSDDSGAATDFAKAMLGALAVSDAGTRYGLITTALWPRGADIRSLALPAPNFFARNPSTDRRLLLASMAPGVPPIDVHVDGWRVELDDALVTQGEAQLRVRRGDGRALRRALLNVAAQPSDIGYLHLYPSIFGVAVSSDHVAAALLIRELET